MGHARRPFVQALRAGEGKDAAFVVQTIKALFRIEQTIALASADKRLEVRQRESVPLVDALYSGSTRGSQRSRTTTRSCARGSCI